MQDRSKWKNVVSAYNSRETGVILYNYLRNESMMSVSIYLPNLKFVGTYLLS